MNDEIKVGDMKTAEMHHEVWARDKFSGAVVEERVGGLRSTKSVCEQEIRFQNEHYPNRTREFFVVKVTTTYEAVS